MSSQIDIHDASPMIDDGKRLEAAMSFSFKAFGLIAESRVNAFPVIFEIFCDAQRIWDTMSFKHYNLFIYLFHVFLCIHFFTVYLTQSVRAT